MYIGVKQNKTAHVWPAPYICSSTSGAARFVWETSVSWTAAWKTLMTKTLRRRRGRRGRRRRHAGSRRHNIIIKNIRHVEMTARRTLYDYAMNTLSVIHSADV